MRRIVMLATALALAAPAVPALAQATKPRPGTTSPTRPAAAELPSDAELQDATQTLSLLVSALNSKDVPQETKVGLMLCLYANPLGKIARGQTELMAADKTIDPKNSTQRLYVLAALCGVEVPGAGKGVEPAKPAEPAKDQ